MAFLKTASGSMILLLFSLSYSQSDSAVIPPGDTTAKTAPASGSYEQRAETSQTLFTAGSIMAITGLIAIAVYGTSDLAVSMGSTLLAIGHGGMIMTGISTIMMKKSVREKYPKLSFDLEPRSGWVVYGSGLGLEAAGLTCMFLAVKSDNNILGSGGVLAFVAGELVTKLSWFSFNNNMKFWKNMFHGISMSPQFQIDITGHKSMGSSLCFTF